MKPAQNLTSRLISLAGIVASVYLIVILIQTVRNNAGLQSQIEKLDKEIVQLKEDKSELNYQIAYYQTDAYKEKAARAKLGLQKPGESLIILPREPKSSQQTAEAKSKPTKTQPNWVQWWHFLFG